MLNGRSALEHRRRQVLPFDHARAHKLYKAPVRRGRGPHQGQASAHRAVRPADAAALPGAGDRDAQGGRAEAAIPRSRLARRAPAVTVLPAVSSLKALRAHRQGRAARAKAYVGFGNPLLDGDRDDARRRRIAPSSRAQAGVPGSAASGRQRACAPVRGGVARVATRGGSPTSRTSRARRRCPRPPTSCAPWPRT